MPKFSVGDRVRLTGAFLRSTGQIAGGEGQSVWTVQPCRCGLCSDGRFILTDQEKHDYREIFTAEELAREPHLKFRHINASNLQRAR